MTTQERFVNDLFDDAVRIEQQYSIPFDVLLAQTALETGWGSSVDPGSNAYFGIKAGDSWKGERRLVQTTEYHPYNSGYTNPQVISITPSNGMYKWSVKDWFRSYPSAYASLKDYAKLLTQGQPYKNALQFKNEPDKFIEQLGAYATDPEYINKLKAVRQSVLSRVQSLNLKKKLIPGGLILMLGVILYFFLRK